MRQIFLLKLILVIPVLLLSGCDLQRNMLYYPGSYVPSREELAADSIEFWPTGPSGYRGFISTVRNSTVKGTVIVFHGNAGTAADRVYYVHTLGHLGYRVILAEYPGYGARKGELGEASFVNDAKETLRIASEKYAKPLYLLGESLGCGVAAAVAKDPPAEIEAIILITPWETLLSVAKEKFPWLPVTLFIKDKYDTIANLKAFEGRITIIGAERDKIIPVHHAETLYKSVSGNRQMWTIKGAGHNDWPEFVSITWWKEIMDFIGGERTKAKGDPV